MSVHANISFFIPHLGCTHRCSFCDQRSITGGNKLPDESDIKAAVETAQKSRTYAPENTEIAFFGGSFTAIDREYMLTLLKAAEPFVKDGTVSGIRISTRPDAIDRERLEILREYGVSAIELGAQSMDSTVLLANKRGHTAEDVIKASFLIKEYGFSLGLQMMTGLYKSSYESDLYTVKEFIKIAPDTVRIYPTVVLKHTALAGFVERGEYIPPSLDDTLKACAEYYKKFAEKGINVIRMGLHHINEEDYIAGPWHPAFSQLCMSRIFGEEALNELKKLPKGNYVMYVFEREISVAVGHKKENILKFKELGYNCRVKGDAATPSGMFRIEKEVR